MADLNDKTVGGLVAFVGEARQIAEQLTVLRDELDSILTRWAQVYGPAVGVKGEDYVREVRDDVRDVSAYQLAALMTQYGDVKAVLDKAGNNAALEIACVRARSARG